jgi:hypothetical protein
MALETIFNAESEISAQGNTSMFRGGHLVAVQDSGRTNGRTAGLSCSYKGSYCKVWREMGMMLTARTASKKIHSQNSESCTVCASPKIIYIIYSAHTQRYIYVYTYIYIYMYIYIYGKVEVGRLHLNSSLHAFCTSPSKTVGSFHR